MTWPTKDDFVDGDVLTAAQVNNIADNLNLADPTGITDGYLLTADGAGSMGWEAPPGGGKVLQVVQGTTTSQTIITSTSLTNTNLTATITPTSATSKILVIFTQSMRAYQAGSTDRIYTGFALVRDSTVIQDTNTDVSDFGFYWGTGNNSWSLHAKQAGVYLDSPATTSPTVYKTQAKVTGLGTPRLYCQEASGRSAIVLLEIAS